MIKVKKNPIGDVLLKDEYGNEMLIPLSQAARIGGLLLFYSGNLVGAYEDDIKASVIRDEIEESLERYK